STSGVVNEPPRFVPSGNITPRVPIVAQGVLLRLRACVTQLAHDVLPFVPVIAITLTVSEGLPYHSSASSPKSDLKLLTDKIGILASTIFSESASSKTATAPFSMAAWIY